MLRASRRKQKTMGLSASRTALSHRGLDISNFSSTYEDVFGDYSTVAQTDAPTNIAIPPVKDVLAAKSSSASALKQAFDSDDHSTASTNQNLVFSATASNVSCKSHAAWHPSLSNTSQSTTIPDQASLTPSISLEDFAGENPLRDFNYRELLDDPLSSFLGENSDKNTLPADLGISPSDPLSDALDISPSYPYKTGPLNPWVQTWPVQDLDDKSWSDIISSKALSRPEWTTVEHLLRLYFQYLNPLLPVLKERDLYYLIHPDTQNDGVQTKPISLALFNAIMFAASSVSPLFSVSFTQILTHYSSCLKKMH